MPAKKIYRAERIVTCNAKHEVIEDGFLAVNGTKIVAVGPWADRPRTRGFSVISFPGGMITPGLFNLHSHLAMVLLRGVMEDVDLQTWLTQYIWPTETKWLSPEFVSIGTELALCESLQAGVTFVTDMYFFNDVTAKLVDKMGMRALLGLHVWDMKPPDYPSAEAMWEGARKLALKWKKHSRVVPALAAHAPYTCSPETLKRTAKLAKELQLPVMIHASETKKEVEDIQKQYGVSPIEYIRDAGLMTVERLLLAHGVWINETDYPILKRGNVSIVLNPQCNAKLGSGIPPVDRFAKEGIRFVMGTDGAASNNNLDIFSEMNFLSKLHHVTTGDLKGLPGPVLFDAATRHAAEAVGLGMTLGSLEPGKDADFIVINTETPHLQPLTRAYSHLICSVQGPDVDSVFVAGKCLMRNKRILVTNEKKVIERAKKYWNKISKSISATPEN